MDRNLQQWQDSLVFVCQWVEKNNQLYHHDILETILLLWSHQRADNQKWTVQQDSRPSPKTTHGWFKAHLQIFNTSQERPPNSSDLNPWNDIPRSILEASACAERHESLESPKQALRLVWIIHDELRAIAEIITVRSRLCIRAKGAHFETG